MKTKTAFFKLLALVACIMCSLSAAAAEAYTVYTASNKTLTFYYDNQRSSRSGTTYDLNTGYNTPQWIVGISTNITHVVFDPSFASARPTSTFSWFATMIQLEDITGLSYLNTSQVTNMSAMFSAASSLESLDLSSFNTSQVKDMRGMFWKCDNLATIYVGSGWNTNAVSQSTQMFEDCFNLVGSKGTTYNANYIDKSRAHVDGGPSNPGYLSAKSEPEAYACYTPSNKTLTFYYDNQWSSRTGTTYNLNTPGDRPQWFYEWFYTGGNPITKVVFQSSFANARPTTTFCWFANMINLQSITGLEYLNTSQVTNMNSMFSSCWALTSLNLSNFNTAKVTNMNSMFFQCNALTSLNLSSFNTAKVTDMCAMFEDCNSLTSLDVSGFNTAQVTRMESMFESCRGLTSLDLANFNTAKVTTMYGMFDRCNNLTTIYAGSGWSTAAVTSSEYMFRSCTKIKGSKGTTYNANHVDKAYAHIDGGTSNPGYLSSTQVEGPYAVYTSSNKTLTFYYDDMRNFRSGTTYDLNTGSNNPGWVTDNTNSAVTRVVFNSSFADARPTTTYKWFGSMSNLQSITGINYLNTTNVTNMAYMFSGSNKLTALDLRSFNTANVTNMSFMFYFCAGLETLDVSSFNTAKVTNMSSMFMACIVLKNLDVSNFNTAKVTNMSGMFANCYGLKRLNLKNFNTAKVTNMASMFDYCRYLETIYAGDSWSTSAVTSSDQMFRQCTSIKGGKGTTFDANHIDKTYARFDGGKSKPGYLSKFLLGDVNNDGEVNIADVNFLIDMILSGEYDIIGDINNDHEISIADINFLIDIILNN